MPSKSFAWADWNTIPSLCCAADWAFMSTWLWIHILAVPTIQHALGLKSLWAVFGLHWFSQILFHRNLNKCVRSSNSGSPPPFLLALTSRRPPNRILVHHLIRKHGLLAAEKPRSRVSEKARMWTKIGGLIGSFLRILSLFLATWDGPQPFQLGTTWLPRLFLYTVSLDFLFYWCAKVALILCGQAI